MDKNELMHYGIRGMKWGVRRYQNPDGSLTPAGKKREKAKNQRKSIRDANKSHIKASKRRRTMSDAELNRRIKRLEKEKRLRELTESEVTPGRKKTKDALEKYGDRAVSSLVGVALGVAATKVARPMIEDAVEKIKDHR